MTDRKQTIEERAFRVGDAYVIDHLADIPSASVLALVDALPLWRRKEVAALQRYDRRRESVLAFLLLMYALRAAGVEGAVDFAFLSKGKPVLRSHPAVCFNMSHCREAVACVVGTKAVGIDVECRGRYKEMVARRVLSADEYARVAAADDGDLEFTKLWTQKEALLKLTGEGVSLEMQNVIPDNAGITFSSFVRPTYVCTTACLR